jgi:Spy/CpxP family protein refolding chaperone
MKKFFAMISMTLTLLAVPMAFGQPGSAASGTTGQSGTSSATHQAGAWRYRSPYAMAMRNAWNQINLTTAQENQIKKIRASDRPEIRALQKQIWSKRRELRAAFQKETFNESLASQKLVEMAPLQAKLMGARYDEHKQIMAVLTPQQRTELQKLQAQVWRNGPKRSA